MGSVALASIVLLVKMDPLQNPDSRLRPGRQLIRRFALISAVLIGLVALVVSWLTGSFLTKNMIEREKTFTVDYIQRAIRGITTTELRAAWKLRLESRPLRTVAEDLRLLPEVVRIKIYDPRGVVIWSDVAELVGTDFHEDDSVREALKGQVRVELEQIEPTPEHKFEHPHFRELMSIYVPYRDESTQELLAVFEIYKYPQFLYRLIVNGRSILWAVVLLGGGVLCLGQFGLVTAASRTIDRQYSELRADADRLEQVNRELKAAQAQLVQSERYAALGKVTTAVAHGIRNPLGNIRLVAQETREGLDPKSPLREPLNEVITQVDLLEERLRHFLTTAKPTDLTLTKIHLLDVVRAAIDGMRARFAEKAIAVEIQPFDGDCSVQGDQVKLEEAVRILLSNSVEAGAKKITLGQCRIVESNGNQGIEFHMIDDGTGLSPSALTHLFEPFYTTKPLGTGLGLVIAKKMVEAHGGMLALHSVQPRGVDATVWLPLLNESNTEAA